MSVPPRETVPALDAAHGHSEPPSAGRALLVLVRDGVARNRRSALVWGTALGLMGALIVAIWPSIGEQMGDLLADYPVALKEAFGVRELDSAEHYVDAEMMSLIVPFAVALLAIRCVVGPTVGAEERAELATTLGLPVDRWVIGTAAVLVAGVIIATALVLVWILTSLGSVLSGADADLLALGRGFLNVWPLALTTAGVALLVAGGVRGSGTVTGIAAAVLVAMYAVDLVGRLAGDLDAVRTVSAFRYYGSAIRDGLDATNILVLVLAAVVFTALGARGLQRRDIG
ncbi:MAG: ABC transporter permease subunit [Solirubrobacteraceae bacterium]